jgi:hypothetical protein
VKKSSSKALPSTYFGEESTIRELDRLPGEEQDEPFVPAAVPVRVNRAVDRLQQRAELQASVS